MELNLTLILTMKHDTNISLLPVKHFVNNHRQKRILPLFLNIVILLIKLWALRKLAIITNLLIIEGGIYICFFRVFIIRCRKEVK
jgi:Na+/glutamate symporter